MSAPLYDALKAYQKSGFISFHMPGHKNGGLLPDLNGLDITELPGFDNLHQPEGLIKESQERMAETFGAEESYFLVNGSTAGIMAAIAGVCSSGGKILIARNSHVAVYRGLAFSGAEPLYCLPAITKARLPGSIPIENIEKMLQKDQTIQAVCVTSPTYEGFTIDIKALAAICHTYKKPLIVDEAHGAHFCFQQYFPVGALQAGADIVIHSLHKTLAVPTSCGLCHVQGPLVNRDRLKEMVSFFQTTSPSYLLMGAMDYARDTLEKNGAVLFSAYVKSLEAFRNKMAGLRHISLLGENFMKENGIFDLDKGKLLFYLPEKGKKIFEDLAENYGIQGEMYSRDTVLLMTSYANTTAHFKTLADAMVELDKNIMVEAPAKAKHYFQPQPVIGCTPREALFATVKTIPLQQAEGCICGEWIIPYPPGIPLIVPGERFTGPVLKILMQMNWDAGELIIHDKSLKTVRVLAE